MPMYSYVQLEKEISGSYREQLSEVKKANEIEKVFTRNAVELIARVSENPVRPDSSEIKFNPDSDPFYDLGEELKKNERVREAMTESDLPAILKRMAQDASKRYHHILRDDDRTETFRIPKNK